MAERRHGPAGLAIRRLEPGDEDRVVEAGTLFDRAPDRTVTGKFFSLPGHHLLMAWVDGTPAGFVTGVETTHPDKGTEMFLYELGVGPHYRRRGIGRALVEELAAIARQRGCYGMWVLTEDMNEAAVRTYTAAGAQREGSHLMLGWQFPADQNARTVAHPSDGPHRHS